MMYKEPSSYAPCPACGKRNAAPIKVSWWGGTVGPALFTQVKCKHCGTRYNGRTGKSDENRIRIYGILVLLVLPLLWILYSLFLNR